MPLDQALKKAMKEIAEIPPQRISIRTGCSYDSGSLKVPFFNNIYMVNFPDISVTGAQNKAVPITIIQLVVLHYCIKADGTPLTGDWIGYRQLPETGLFEQRFNTLVKKNLIKKFGYDWSGFKQAALSFGGIPINLTGDASFYFRALSKVPIACVLYTGDEEVFPSVKILFDSSISHYLPTEDITFLCSHLSSRLVRQNT